MDEDVPAAPRTATLTCAGRLVENSLVCLQDDRRTASRRDCISNQLN